MRNSPSQTVRLLDEVDFLDREDVLRSGIVIGFWPATYTPGKLRIFDSRPSPLKKNLDQAEGRAAAPIFAPPAVAAGGTSGTPSEALSTLPETAPAGTGAALAPEHINLKQPAMFFGNFAKIKYGDPAWSKDR